MRDLRASVLEEVTEPFLAQQGKLTEPGLLLSEPREIEPNHDGILSVSEIYRLRLDADLVLLSACDTGAIGGNQGGLSELAQAFAYAGARNLIVTHWPIDSAVAIEISKRLALILKEGRTVSTAMAMQKVIEDLLGDPSAKRFHHPKYWASHFVIGTS